MLGEQRIATMTRHPNPSLPNPSLRRLIQAEPFAVRQALQDLLNHFPLNALDPDQRGTVEVWNGGMPDGYHLGIDGISVSPGYAYERAPDQQHFLNRKATKELFRGIFSRALPGKKKWQFNQSSMFLDFLAGALTYAMADFGLIKRPRGVSEAAHRERAARELIRFSAAGFKS